MKNYPNSYAQKKSEKNVVVCIPYFHCAAYIRRSVLSILNQTHKNLKVVVINDSDIDTPPWPYLADISDRRLIRFDLAKNHGPYFATQVVLTASSAEYLLIQDADDWSHPERISKLLEALESNKTDFAFSTTNKFCEDTNGNYEFIDTLWKKMPTITFESIMKWQVPHWGLFRTSSLIKIGGYYCGFPFGYDTLLINLILFTGKISFVNEPLYNYFVRPQSLTTSNYTGFHSEYRRQLKRELQSIYSKIRALYIQFNNGMLPGKVFFQHINQLYFHRINEKDKLDIHLESKRLNAVFNLDYKPIK